MSDDPRLFDAFDDCLTRLAAGEAIEACLRRHPDLAAELRPMLEAAQEGMAASRAPHHVEMRSRARFLGAAAARRPQPARAGWLGGWLGRTFSTAITLAVGFLLGTTGLYYASAATLPGDTLYGVKRAFESARIQLASDPGQRYALEQNYDLQRTTELQAVLSQDRAVTVNFGGVLTGRSETAWQIGGFNVAVTPETQIEGDPQPGFYVAVVAENRNGTLVALELAAEEEEIIGVLERSGSQWAIGGASFAIGPETVVSGPVAPGMTAAARIRTLHTGERVAVSVVTLAPTPVLSPTTEPTRTALPSATPAPTRAVRATAPPAPSATPLPATAAPTQASTQQPAFTAPPAGGDDNGNSNQGEDDNSNSGGEDNGNSNSGGEGDGDNSGPGGGDDGGDDGNSNSGGGEDDGGDDHSGSGGGEDSSGSGGGGDSSGSGSGDD